MTKHSRSRLGWLIAAALALAPSAEAQTLRFSGAAPPLTLDPHGTNDFATMAIFRQLYDSLVALDARTVITPGLAVSWELTPEKSWRFHLRPGVKFHDGSVLKAEDVAFSILRQKGSGYYSSLFGGITEARIVDDLTIEVVSKEPDPLLPQKMGRLFVMSKAWSLAHDLQAIPNLGAQGSEAWSVRHAIGTGPMRLNTQEPGIRTVLDRNPDDWRTATGNLKQATYLPIGNSATRVAALLSGEVDLVIDLPLQDVERVRGTAGLALHQVPQMLWMQIEMDGTREATLSAWDKAGQPLKTNPLKDVRVRRAIAEAVDVKLIIDRVLRGQGRVVGIPSLPNSSGYQAALDTHWPVDPAHAKALMAEAGYGEGFTVQLNCPTERYASAEDVCRALASMLGRIGIEVKVNAMVWPDFARMLVNGPNSSFHIIGLSSVLDTQDVFVSDMMTRDPKSGEGFFNWALWHSDALDRVARELRVTFDPARRDALYKQGLTIAKDEVYAVYLYQPQLSYGSKANVDAPVRSDSTVMLQDVVVH